MTPPSASRPGPSLEACLRQMLRIRRFEEAVEQCYARGMIHGTMHLSIGQEATAVGAVAALEPDDYILSTHRGHGHCLAKGADPRRMFAELFGKEDGYCRGRGGSMHIADFSSGNLGANGIVAGGLPISVGVGLSIKARRSGQVCMTFFGDGAANEGAFHEALNMAAIWALPVAYVCENNQYGMSMPVARASAVPEIAARACAYGIRGSQVDGNDVEAVFAAARDAVAQARSGGGPSLVECRTYRLRGHSKSDRNLYRTKDEIEAWRARDPILRLREQLLAGGRLTARAAEALEAEVAQEIDEALEAARQGTDPELRAMLDDVYAG